MTPNPPNLNNLEDAYPLAGMQGGMLFHSIYDNDNTLYHDIFSYHLWAPLIIDLFEEALHLLVQRHSVLRTSFDLTNFSEPLQLVYRVTQVPLGIDDIRLFSTSQQETIVDRWREKEKKRPFDVTHTPLICMYIHHCDTKRWWLTISFHHAILDGWSVATLFTELLQDYFTLLSDKPIHPFQLQSTFRDYVALERLQLQSEESRNYWTNLLNDSPLTTLSYERSINHQNIFTMHITTNHRVYISPEVEAALRQLAMKADVPLKSVLLAAHLRVISLLSGQYDIVTGLITNGRLEEPDGDRTLGLFLNTLPLRLKLAGDNWVNLVRQTFEAERELLPYRRYPLSQLLHDLGRSRIFETAFNFNHFHTYQTLQTLADFKVLDLKVFQATDLSLVAAFSLDAAQSHLWLDLDYDASLFSQKEISDISSYYIATLTTMAHVPYQNYTLVSLLTQEEQQKMLVEWNTTRVPYPDMTCVHELFEMQAIQSPDSIAVVCRNEHITYQELNTRANRCARYLRKLGARAEIPVILCLERSIEVSIWLLAILKAGAIYVPLDARNPREWLERIIANVQAPLIVTKQHLLPPLSLNSLHIVYTDLEASLINLESATNLLASYRSDNAAYIIHTSGSTGSPKGVIVSHQSFCNLLQAQMLTYAIKPESRILQFVSLSFDVSLADIFMTLLAGATLCIATDDALFPGTALLDLLSEQAITTFQIPASLLSALTPTELPELSDLIIGGETCPVDTAKEWSVNRNFYNAYGPTEATITTTTAAYRNISVRLAIGRPIQNTSVYLLDTFLQPIPIGTPGELYIGGSGLARGYLHLPDLTAEQFIPNPFNNESGTRLYKTGDIARYLVDGSIEYLGRIDHQVKIHGFRIETGEIEAVLRKHPSIHEVCVAVKEEGPDRKHLVAYIVPFKGHKVSNSVLRHFLEQKLARYMMPAHFIHLDSLPRHPSGKINHRELPSLETIAQPPLTDTLHVARTETEKVLVDIWSKVLGRKQVGIQENFFELGGDSILSMRVVSLADQAGIRIKPRQIFEHQAIAVLAAIIDMAAPRPAMSIDENNIDAEPIPLTPIQHWFFERQLVNLHHWNQAVLIELPSEYTYTMLQLALHHLVDYHDALHTHFVQTPSGWLQTRSASSSESFLQRIELVDMPTNQQEQEIESVATRLQASCNLENGPLFLGAFFERGNNVSGLLVLVAHHLIIDAVSWRILLEDLSMLYEKLATNRPLALPPKTTSYKQWAERLVTSVTTSEVEHDIEYWQTLPWSQVHSLPIDQSVTNFADANIEANSVSTTFWLSETVTKKLLQTVPALYHTQINDALLTALVRAFVPWTQTRTLLIDLEGHGREDIFEYIDLSRTIGWFTSFYPVLLDLSASTLALNEVTIISDLKVIKEQLRQIPKRGIAYGLGRYLSANSLLQNSLKNIPKAEVSFNYLGQYDLDNASATFKFRQGALGPCCDPRAMRSHLISINALVREGRFSIDWNYCKSIHKSSTISELGQRFCEELQAIATTSQSSDESGYTPSDFPLAKLNQQQLDQIMQKMNRKKA